MQDVKSYMDSFVSVKQLSKKQQSELCKIIKHSKNKDEVEIAKNKIIEGNLKLVVKCANKFKKQFHETNVDIMDLISEGNIALIKSIEKYDPDNKYGANFTSFAFPIINAYIINAIKSFRIIKIPSNYFLYRNQINKLTIQHGGDITDDMICEELNIKTPTLDRYREYIDSKYTYIDQLEPEVRDANIRQLTFIENGGFSKVDSEEFKNFIGKHLSKLPEKQKYILSKLYLSDEKVTLEQIANTFGDSKQNVDATRKRAIERIKKSLICDMSVGDYKDFLK